ncbi:aspartate 1-decarboxylase [Cutibacterium sp.]|uniref:aspartate 1-decarboxylase n=1 Tax=Cutibacterium sp. TaxID=1912221 RepID=UPI0026DCCAB6|nr:aspartate 1-decarboxylase [Cutibacterium sp.]MDO4412317.1 aspartate 1-decarboxylase [Cutibacterium sp.]
MDIEMLQAKIHRARVTQAELDYVGSITVDQELLEAAGIREYQKVQVVDIDNGARFETYTIAGDRGSGMICLNGAAARCAAVNDKVIIMAYGHYQPQDLDGYAPKVVFVDENNHVAQVAHYEKHGQLSQNESESK